MRAAIPRRVRLVDLGVNRTLSALPRLVSYLNEHRPAALVSSKTHANVLAMLAHLVSRTDARIILCEHSRCQFERVGNFRDRISLSLAARLYPLADQIVAVAPDIATACSTRLGLRSGLIQVIPNPVVTPELRQQALAPGTHAWLTEDAFLYLGVGRLVPEKGFDTLIRAFHQVSQRVDVRLLILGEGPLRTQLEQLVAQLKLQDLVELPGNVDNPLPFMRDAGAFVLSSVSEGFPMVLVEAMLAGATVIATDCSAGVSDVLGDGEFGTLVPVNDMETLAETMADVALKRPYPEDTGRARAEGYSVERIALLYAGLLPRD
jgi:glycosyltransferase involved in cell wall biosynthesis